MEIYIFIYLITDQVKKAITYNNSKINIRVQFQKLNSCDIFHGLKSVKSIIYGIKNL